MAFDVSTAQDAPSSFDISSAKDAPMHEQPSFIHEATAVGLEALNAALGFAPKTILHNQQAFTQGGLPAASAVEGFNTNVSGVPGILGEVSRLNSMLGRKKENIDQVNPIPQLPEAQTYAGKAASLGADFLTAHFTPEILGAIDGIVKTGKVPTTPMEDLGAIRKEMQAVRSNTATKSNQLSQAEQAAQFNTANFENQKLATIDSQIEDVTNKMSKDNKAAVLLARERHLARMAEQDGQYGREQAAITEGTNIPRQNLQQALDQALAKNNIDVNDPNAERNAVSPSEAAIIRYRNKIASGSPGEKYSPILDASGKPIPVSIEENLPVQNVLDDFQRLTAHKGEYGPGEHVLSDVKQALTDQLLNIYPKGVEMVDGKPQASVGYKLAQLRDKYIPEWQARRASEEIFQPRSDQGAFDTSKGIDFLNKVGTDGFSPQERPDAQMLQQYIEKNYGPEITAKTKAYGKTLDQLNQNRDIIPSELNRMKQDIDAHFNDKKISLKQATQQRMEVLKQELANTVNKIQRERAIKKFIVDVAKWTGSLIVARGAVNKIANASKTMASFGSDEGGT